MGRPTVCDSYRNSTGGILNDGSPCKTCGFAASAHPDYLGNNLSAVGANATQVGGGHYKTGGEEHWDRIWRLYGRGYFVGCITKYVERYHKKNGMEDLKKAKHFLEKLIELESKGEAGGVLAGQEYSGKVG